MKRCAPAHADALISGQLTAHDERGALRSSLAAARLAAIEARRPPRKQVLRLGRTVRQRWP